MPRIQPHDHSSFNQGGLIRPPAGLTGGADSGTVVSGGTGGGPGVIHAVDVLVQDTAGLLAAANVEDALAELAAGDTLDDLTDVVVASPLDKQRPRYSTVDNLWHNSSLVWEVHVSYDGTVVLDGAGNPVQTEVTY